MRKRCSPLVVLSGAIVLASGIRLLFLITPFMDSDQAINGLMARHVLQGEFPFFFYGQDYCGSIESYLAAAVFFLFGVSRGTLNAAIGLFSLTFILFLYFFVRRIADRRTASLTVLFSAVPSYYLVFHSVLARSAYIEIPTIGVLLFIFAHRLLSESPPGKTLFFMLGFFTGLGIWTHFLVIYFLPPVFFLLLIRYWRLWRPALLFLFPGVLLGGLPLWTHNIIHPLVTWHYLKETSGGGEPVISSFWAFFRFRLPEVVGLMNNETGAFILPLFAPLCYLLYLAAFGWWILGEGKRFWAAKQAGFPLDRGLLPFFFFLFPFIFAFSGFASAHTSRYLMPLFAALPFVFARITLQLKDLSPILSFLFLGLHLFCNLWGTLERSPVFDQALKERYVQTLDNEQRLLKKLKEEDLRRVYCPDYWTSVRLTFDAKEEILFAAPFNDRYPPYTRLVDQSTRPAFLFPGDHREFEETLKAIGGTYRKEQWFGYSVYYDFSPPPYDFIEVPPLSPGEESGLEKKEQEKVFDRDLNTRWSLGGGQRSGTRFLVDLGRTVPELCRVTLYAGTPEELPRGIRLEASEDGRVWETVREIPSFFGSLFWSGPHPFHRPGDRVELIFPPRPARFLRLTQLGNDPTYSWSIAECFIYQARPRSFPPDPGARTVLSFLRKSSLGRVYSDPWLTAFSRGDRGVWPENREDIRDVEKEVVELRGKQKMLLAVEKAYATPLERFLSFHLGTTDPGREIAGYRLFPLATTRSVSPIVESKGWKATASVNPGKAYLAFDGKLATRWTTDRPQRPGDFFQLDLGRAEKVSGLHLQVGESRKDFPRGLAMYYSEDGIHWSPVQGQRRPLVLRWTGETLLPVGGDGEIRFPPVLMRYLKLVQTGEDPVYYWSIHEIELFRPPNGFPG